jgi:hypothetical protein
LFVMGSHERIPSILSIHHILMAYGLFC